MTDPSALANQIESSINQIASDISYFRFVVNIGKKEYIEALKMIVKKHKLFPYSAIYDNASNNFRYITSPDFIKYRNAIVEKLQFKAEFSTQDLIYISELYDIPEPMKHIDKRNYYLASICIKTATSFLIEGPTGSGKSFFVKEVVSNLKRNKSYIELNCAYLSGELLLSHLFGHIKGAFTGAVIDKKGYVEEYSKGIIFLDEIGELSLKDQAKILKFIETGYYSKLGSTKEIKSEALLLFATNQDIKEMCQSKLFRWDLYYRISNIKIYFKPFKNLEIDDKSEIIDFIIKNCNDILKERYYNKSDYQDKSLKKEAVEFIICECHWPGNIREIYNTIHKAFIFTLDTEITRYDIYKSIDDHSRDTAISPFDIKFTDINGKKAMELVNNFKRSVAEVALKENKIQKRAAASIGLNEQTFSNWLKFGK